MGKLNYLVKSLGKIFKNSNKLINRNSVPKDCALNNSDSENENDSENNENLDSFQVKMNDKSKESLPDFDGSQSIKLNENKKRIILNPARRNSLK